MHTTPLQINILLFKGTTIISFPDGKSIQTSPDGTSITCYPNGSWKQICADGTKIQANADGSTMQVWIKNILRIWEVVEAQFDSLQRSTLMDPAWKQCQMGTKSNAIKTVITFTSLAYVRWIDVWLVFNCAITGQGRSSSKLNWLNKILMMLSIQVHLQMWTCVFQLYTCIFFCVKIFTQGPRRSSFVPEPAAEIVELPDGTTIQYVSSLASNAFMLKSDLVFMFLFDKAPQWWSESAEKPWWLNHWTISRWQDSATKSSPPWRHYYYCGSRWNNDPSGSRRFYCRGFVSVMGRIFVLFCRRDDYKIVLLLF